MSRKAALAGQKITKQHLPDRSIERTMIYTTVMDSSKMTALQAHTSQSSLSLPVATSMMMKSQLKTTIHKLTLLTAPPIARWSFQAQTFQSLLTLPLATSMNVEPQLKIETISADEFFASQPGLTSDQSASAAPAKIPALRLQPNMLAQDSVLMAVGMRQTLSNYSSSLCSGAGQLALVCSGCPSE